MGKADIHIHTTYSYDATTTVRGVLKQASQVGMDVVAITDHDEVRGSLEARELASRYGLEVIPGSEVSTSEGHLLALFVEKKLPSNRPLIETLLRIDDLGGIAVAPHPANPLPDSLSMQSIVAALAHQRAGQVLKGLEVYTLGYSILNRLSQNISNFLPLAKIAATDAHIYSAVGSAYTAFEGSTAQDFRAALDNFSTVPVPAKGDFSIALILKWLAQMPLRKLGFAAESVSPEAPVSIRRIHDKSGAAD